jgi:site-specific DNA recombinase
LLLHSTTYIGEAHYGKRRVVARRPQLRPRRHQPEVPRRAYSLSKTQTPPLPIAVPALVSAPLFAQVAEQLAENRCRARARRTGASCLLQGLVVCRQCGYACCGIGRSRAGAAGGPHYRYYCCCGRQQVDAEGHRVCQVRPLHAAALEAAVWEDVCALLAEPARVEQEYQRRLEGGSADAAGAEGPALAKRIAGVQKALSRLIDGYSEGLLEKEEFEPRLRSARERLARLEAEAQTQADSAAQRAELRLVIGKLQEFAEGIRSGLEEADRAMRREVIRALVKQIEVGDEAVRIVYRVPPVPFVERPDGGVLQDCGRRPGLPFYF